jgi:hypothetical protein
VVNGPVIGPPPTVADARKRREVLQRDESVNYVDWSIPR